MHTIARYAYRHRSLLRRLVFIRWPVLLRLPDFKLYVRLDDMAVGAGIAVRRVYEKHVTDAMRPLLQPGTVLTDIGANIGYYTLLAAARLGPHGKVIAFEPGHKNYTLLCSSLQANGFQNVELYPYAVAAKEGVVSLEMSDSNGRISNVPTFQRSNLPTFQPSNVRGAVRTVALDTCLADEPRIDVIKMDIEGAEGLALQGMGRLLRRHRPVVFTEFSPADLEAVSGVAPAAFVQQWRDLQYEILILERSGRVTVLEPQASIMEHLAASGMRHLDLMLRPRLTTKTPRGIGH